MAGKMHITFAPGISLGTSPQPVSYRFATELLPLCHPSVTLL